MFFESKCVYLSVFLFHAVIFQSLAQQQQDSSAEILIKPDATYENVFTFEVNNEPTLKQIAGAPAAHYSYFWEFGDGTYSTEKNPTHIYNDKKGGKVKVSLTNNYGSGGVPRLRHRNRRDFQRRGPSEVPDSKWKNRKKENGPLSKNEPVKLQNNHSPRPGDPLVCVLSYQNDSDEALPLSGTLYFFYNEKSFSYDNFSFVEARYHHQEVFQQGMSAGSISSIQSGAQDHLLASRASYGYYGHAFLQEYEKRIEPLKGLPQYIPGGKADKALKEARKRYRNVLSWKFDQLGTGEKRNIFTSLETSPDMINDTTNTITYKAVMIPDYKDDAKEFTLKMTIQSSHDPNKMSVSHRKIRKGMIKRTGVTYTIKFQNTGRGAAGNILIENTLPEFLDPATIKIKNFYPKPAMCLNADTLQRESCLDTTRTGQLIKWQFKNIYLPGTRQSDREGRKATKGFIEFSVMPRKKLNVKESLQTRAYIYFDKNDPVKTNKAKTKVVKNVSLGLRAGLHSVTENSDDVLGGISIAPFSPKGIYYQAELAVSRISYTAFENISENVPISFDPNGGPILGTITSRSEITSYYFDIIPIQLRTNISPFLSVGAGVQVSALMRADEKSFISRQYNPVRGVVPFPDESEESEITVYDWPGDKDSRFNDIEPGFFLDLQAGLVRKGPSLGLRYLQRQSKRPAGPERSETASRNYLQLYATFRF